MEANQIKFGRQTAAYGDHVYSWEIYTAGNETKKDIWDFINDNLETSKYHSKDEYVNAKRNAKSFEESMQVVCAGWSELHKTDYGYLYNYFQEYID